MATPTTREGEGRSSPSPPSPFLELPDKQTFFALSFGVFSAGVLGGVWHVMRRERFKFDIRAHRTPFAIASRALFLGTALCFGSFAAGTAALVTTTGITSFEEFAMSLEGKLGQVDALKTKNPVVLADIAKIRQFSEKDEMDYWWNRFFGDGDGDSEKEKTTEEVPKGKT